MEWNKTRLIDFFLENIKKEIILQELDSSFSFHGEINSLEELDLCSYRLPEVQLIQKISKSEFYLTIHEKSIGIHFKIFCKELKKVNNKAKKQIQYSRLSVSLAN